MKLSLALPAALTAIVVLSGCSGGSRLFSATRSSNSVRGDSSTAIPGGTINRLEAAAGTSLQDSQIESYIDPSVVGQDRALLHKLMATMPSKSRGDLIFWDSTAGHMVSNNTAQLDIAPISTGKNVSRSSSVVYARTRPVISSTFNRSSHAANVRRPSDYGSACAPPPSNTGAYVRDVSACGMTDGWGFVSVDCGTSQFAPGDAGYLYMEMVAGEVRIPG